MTLRHVFVSLAVTCLAACSSDDTIVSLNVAATDRVPVVESMKVTFQQGSRSLVYNFTPPSDLSKEGDPTSIKNNFFERITLPSEWDGSEATISVEGFQEGGAAFDPPLADETKVKIEKEGVVVAYVDLDRPAAPPPPMGGAGGEAGAGGAGEGGAPAGQGGAPGAGGVPSEAGGEANAGGTAGDASEGGVGGVGGAD